MKSKYNLITVLGPTAGGKTGFASNLANRLNTEIISADSRQVYRKMDIGTGKDLADYVVDGKQIPYHLIDILDAGEKYNLFNFQRDFFKIYETIIQKGKIPIMCGGTGLYVDAIVSNYELNEVPENKELRAELSEKSLDELADILRSYKKLHNVSEIDTKKRAIRAIEIEVYNQSHPKVEHNFPAINSLNIGIKFDRESQKRRIAERLEQRLAEGMIDEVRELMADGVDSEVLLYYGLEYKFVTLFLLGKLTYDEMKEGLRIAICQFSKRQMTWFRRMERNGVKIYWLDGYASLADKLARFEVVAADWRTR